MTGWIPKEAPRLAESSFEGTGRFGGGTFKGGGVSFDAKFVFIQPSVEGSACATGRGWQLLPSASRVWVDLQMSTELTAGADRFPRRSITTNVPRTSLPA